MNAEYIHSHLTDEFGINLDIKETRYPDREEIIIRPKDFEKRKGFLIISTLKWLSLNTRLEFESFAGDILAAIMNNHKTRIGIFIQSINLIRKDLANKNLYGYVDNAEITDSYDKIDLTRLSLYVDNPTINLEIKTKEEHIIDHQKTILSLVLLLFQLKEIPDTEYPIVDGLPEGAISRVAVNRYERSRINRQACLNYHGYDCKICGFNFEKKYGEIGKEYIHVHHIIPVSEIGDSYIINPIRDLLPVCPNCHSMIHSGKSTIPVEILRDHIKYFETY